MQLRNKSAVHLVLKELVSKEFSTLASKNEQWVTSMSYSYIEFVFNLINEHAERYGTDECLRFISTTVIFGNAFFHREMLPYMDMNFCSIGIPANVFPCTEDYLTVREAHERINELVKGLRCNTSRFHLLSADLLKMIIDRMGIRSFSGIPWSTEHYKAIQ
jgi:hypothetical protein